MAQLSLHPKNVKNKSYFSGEDITHIVTSSGDLYCGVHRFSTEFFSIDIHSSRLHSAASQGRRLLIN